MARSVHDSKKIRFGLGSGNNLGKTKTTTETIAKFKERFAKPLVTNEKFHEYKKMTDAQQRHLKGVNGWFMRGAVAKGENRNRNSILPSQIITLDIDYATPEWVQQLIDGEILPGYMVAAHSTRSSTPEKPRLRLMVFLKGNLDREMYQAASRIVAQLADPNLEHVDKVSFRPAQMMYMPTVSKDMAKHYVWYEQDGELLDHEEVIESWEMTNGSATDIGNLPKTPDEDELRETAEKAEDPLEKKGPVGDFCRAYTITDLIHGKDGEKGILADYYEVVEEAQGAITRMTYSHGTTSNGAVVYDDLFVYSHHGSDPTCDMLVNAYDLVRIHKFGDEDKNSEKDTPISKLPSTKKMAEWLRTDDNYRIAQAESRYDLDSMFTDDDVDYDPDEAEDDEDDDDLDAEDLLGMPLDTATGDGFAPSVRRKKADKPPKKWIAKELELTDDGVIKTTMHNIAKIILYDPRFWRKIAYNEFNYQIVVTDDLKSKQKLIPTLEVKDKENGDRWQEINDIIIRALIEAPTQGGAGYGIKVGKEMVHDAVKLAARANSFHPIREYLEHVRGLNDKKPGCIDTMLIDYFGAEDNVYTRAVSRLMMIASVARVMEPGCKYDYAVIFEGPQGIGKSTAIMRLYGKQYFSEIDGNLNDRKYVAEQMTGSWAQELPELSAMHRGEANDTKAFMTRTKDDVRLSYDRNVSELPRQSVIYGTTNDTKYLRDTTGGRRFLPVLLHDVESIDVIGLMKARDALWCDAYEGYIEMRRKTHADHDLPLFLQGEAAEIAKDLQERARKKEPWENWMEELMDWVDEEHTLQGFMSELGGDVDFGDDTHFWGYPLESTVCRVAFTMKQAFNDAYDFNNNVTSSAQQDQYWNKVVEELKKLGWVQNEGSYRVGGKKGRWIMRPDITETEKRQGFRVLNSAQAPGIAGSQVPDDDDDEDSLL